MSPTETRLADEDTEAQSANIPAPLVRLRTVDPLVMEVSGTKITISSPLATKRLRVGPVVAQILISARAGFVPASSPPATIARLVESGFLVDADSSLAAIGAPWDEWGTTAWNFHTRVRDTNFVINAQLTEYKERLATRSRPSSIRRPASDRILLLPRVRSPLGVSFREVLEGRRTHRNFVEHTLDLDAFSDLLHYSFAPLRFIDAGDMGVVQFRASASGGARHETEAFVFVFNVASVHPGLYHYDNIRHGLEPLRDDVGRAELEHITHGQGFFEHASFGVLTAAIAERMSWKYPHLMAYKMLLHNVGHVAQVFSMTAAALGLGAAITGAIRDSEADRLLGLREPGEFTTFALGCGLAVLGQDGLPTVTHPPSVAPDYY